MAESPKEAPKNIPNETAAAIQELARSLIAQAPKSPLEMSGLSPEAQQTLTGTPTPKRWRLVPGKSEETGATFDLHIVESRGMPHGRVTQLLNYRHPEGIYRSQSNGGRMPDGFPIWKDNKEYVPPEGQEPPRSLLTPQYLQWRWTTFWQSDIRTIVGKELRQRYCLTDDGFKTPWQQGKVAVVTEDAA